MTYIKIKYILDDGLELLAESFAANCLCWFLQELSTGTAKKTAGDARY